MFQDESVKTGPETTNDSESSREGKIAMIIKKKKIKRLVGKKPATNTIRTATSAITSISTWKSGTLSKYSTHKMLLRDC